jgi:hypothetical protein
LLPKLKGTRANIVVVELCHAALSLREGAPCRSCNRERRLSFDELAIRIARRL